VEASHIRHAAQALADEQPALAARGRPLELSLGVQVDEASFDTLPERIEAEIKRGATRIDLGIHTVNLTSYLDLQPRIGEQVLPEFRR